MTGPIYSAFPMDAGGQNVFLAAAEWLRALLLGSVATSLAVVAVASIGLLMLSGRLNIRRGATVILGCFILFGSARIAQGLHHAGSVALAGPTRTAVVSAPALTARSTPLLAPASGAASDPYAGASIRR